MPGQFRHETLAKPHDFRIRFTLGIEVGSALAAAHGERGQGILENLFEGQEFENTEVDRGVKAQPPFVGADGAVHLDPETAVDMHLPLVILPGNTKQKNPLRFGNAFHDSRLAVLRAAVQDRLDRLNHLINRLVKLTLPRIAILDQL